jgi:elongation factor Ts
MQRQAKAPKAKLTKQQKQPKRQLTTKKVAKRAAIAPLTVTKRNNSNVTAAMVKKLRDATGAPMIECKKALATMYDTPDFDATNTDAVMKGASEYLRKRGAALANKNAGRSAKEGVVVLAFNAQRTKAAMVELNCETDFVARNGTFQTYASRIALSMLNQAPKGGSADPNFDGLLVDVVQYMDGPLAEGPSAMPSNPNAASNDIKTELIDVITNCRENIKLRRAGVVEVPAGSKGFVSAYMHNELPVADEFRGFFDKVNADGTFLRLGNHGAIGAFTVDDAAENVLEASDLCRKVMMQAVASSPTYLARKNIPQEVLAKEKEIMLAQTPLDGKPQHIVDKLIEGKLNKFYSAVSLLDQEYSLTNDSKPPTIQQLLDGQASKPKPAALLKFLRGEILAGEPETTEEAPQ